LQGTSAGIRLGYTAEPAKQG